MDSNTDTKGALALRLSEVAALAAEQERPASDVALELLTGDPVIVSDMQELIDEARQWAEREADELGSAGYSAVTLNLLADALEALNREKENLSVRFRNQVDAATELIRQLERAEVEVVRLNRENETLTHEIEWGTEIRDDHGVLIDRDVWENESDARRSAKVHSEQLIKRTVGPWVEVAS